MDQFVTTYRKDFLWPYIRSFGLRPDTGPPSADGHGDLCSCQCQRDSGGGKMIAPNIFDQETFQKSGPTLPLMDPKLYPARVGPAPESEGQRFNQPNIFLEKLKIKYPFLYEILRTSSPDDVITKINKDRLRTTYQVDFCHLNEYPSGPYEDLLRAAGLRGTGDCSEPVRLPGDPCRPNQKNLGFRPASITGAKFEPTGKSSGDKCGGSGSMGGPTLGAIVSMGTTEYQDAISKLGDLIIKDKIHHPRRSHV